LDLALLLLAIHGCTSASAAPPVRPAPQAAASPSPQATGEVAQLTAPAAPASDEGMPVSDDGDPDDELEGADLEPQRAVDPQKAAILKLSDQEIEERLRRDPAALGSMSVGRPNAGGLINGVQMPRGERWELIDPANAWGTRETIEDLVRSIDKVSDQFPGAPALSIGHISRQHGGHLSPHKSHQSGRDADVGYYYRTTSRRWFTRATSDNLDLEKTWALLKAVITGTDVEMIFIDSGIQRLLADYAAKRGEDTAWLDEVFQIRAKHARPIIRHAKGHATHIHFRFNNPVAQEMARRAHVHPPEAAPGPAALALNYVQHKARSGDTLVILARRYATTVEAIQEANGLRSTALRAGVIYKIPQKAAAKAPAPPHPKSAAKSAAASGSHGPRHD